LAVPGGQTVSATALTHVTVSATHRRQGLLTRMITADLTSCAERGDAVGVLVAAEYPIYGRFGYGPVGDGVRYDIDATSAQFLTDVGGTIEPVDRDAYVDRAPAVYARAQRDIPGAIERAAWWWDIVFGVVTVAGRKVPTFFALGHDDAGRLDGILAYSVTDRWIDGRPRSVLDVFDLVGVDAAATVRLWRHCIETDWVGQVVADDRGVDDPLRWYLADARVLAERDRGDRLWLRVLDTSAALAGRRYLTPGRVVLEIDDPGGFAAGRFVLDGGPDGATCDRTDAPADLRLDVQTLSAAYLGGIPLAQLAAVGRVDERTPGSVRTADAMFRGTTAPWCATHF
jgi:predicted acetyltransferase